MSNTPEEKLAKRSFKTSKRESLLETAGSGAHLGPVLVCMQDVEAREVNWLWPERIVAGRLNLLVGMPGAGKSFLTCDMASRVSTGTPWPDGSNCPRGSVLLISAEDDPHDTIRPRLDAHHADVSRIHLLSTVRRLDEDGKEQELMFTLEDVNSLEAALIQVGNCKLIVVDPIGSFLGGRTDAHRDNEVRSVLAPVAKLAEKYGPAVVVVAHRRKAASSIADDTALGSRAFTGIARAVWHLTRDRENKNRRLLVPGKQNLAAQQTGLAFTICGEPAAVSWEREPVEMTADEAMSMENDGTGQGSAVDEAAAWLRNELAGGPVRAKKIKEGARASGISLRTLDRAKSKLQVVAGPDGFGGPWVWRLPECATVSAECANDERLAHSDETGALCMSAAKNGDDWGEV
jgi:putative DNA primase/helicase